MVNVKFSLCSTKHHAMKVCGEWRHSSTHSQEVMTENYMMLVRIGNVGGEGEQRSHTKFW